MPKRKSESTYYLIMNDIQEKIRNGTYPPGRKLPSVRELAAEYGYTRGNVLYALNRLAWNGIICSEPKKGFYVVGDPSCRKLRIGLFCIGLNIEFMFQHLADVSKLIRLDHDEVLFRYAPHINDGVMRDFLRERGRPDALIITGIVTDRDLEPVVKSAFPYFVTGTQDISPCHPQYAEDVEENYRCMLLPVFREFRDRKIGALLGDPAFLADRLSRAGVIRAIEDAGAEVCTSRIINATVENASAACETLFRRERPDVLFVNGAMTIPVGNYLRTHTVGHKPYLIKKQDISRYGKEYYDRILPSGTSAKDNEKKAIRNFLAELRKKGRRDER